MQGTKSEILRLLKRGGPASVDELAIHLGFAGVTVRQHLIALERDGFIEASDYRKGTGRPSRLYQLSEKGDASFPPGYDILARLVLESVAHLNPVDIANLCPEERTDLILARCAERVAAPYLSELAACDFQRRTTRAVAILEQLSGFVEVDYRAEGVEVRDYNCAYRKVANLGQSPCAWHSHLLSLLLGCEVCWQTEPRNDCCAVFVSRQAAAIMTISAASLVPAVSREGRTG